MAYFRVKDEWDKQYCLRRGDCGGNVFVNARARGGFLCARGAETRFGVKYGGYKRSRIRFTLRQLTTARAFQHNSGRMWKSIFGSNRVKCARSQLTGSAISHTLGNPRIFIIIVFIIAFENFTLKNNLLILKF